MTTKAIVLAILTTITAVAGVAAYAAESKAQQMCYTTCTTWNGQMNCVTNCQ